LSRFVLSSQLNSGLKRMRAPVGGDVLGGGMKRCVDGGGGGGGAAAAAAMCHQGCKPHAHACGLCCKGQSWLSRDGGSCRCCQRGANSPSQPPRPSQVL
jgi:hypothetical protein